MSRSPSSSQSDLSLEGVHSHPLDAVSCDFSRLGNPVISDFWSTTEGREYYAQGFIRRLQTIRTCLDHIDSLYPFSSKENKVLPSQVSELVVYMQAHIFNMSGAIDNLAWVYAHEKKLTTQHCLNKGDIGFSSNKNKFKKLRELLPERLIKFINSQDDFFNYLVEYRDALAHRIPPYIPKILDDEETKKLNNIKEQQGKLWNQLISSSDSTERLKTLDKIDATQKQEELVGIYMPIMAHSLRESGGKYVFFNERFLLDWKTIYELAYLVLDAIGYELE